MASSRARAICSAAILQYIIAIISILLFLGTSVETAKILAIFSVPARSHVGAYQPLMEELARRGHEMTVVTPFPRTKPLENYNEIIIEDTFPSRDSSEMNLFEYGKNNFLFTMLMMSKIFVSSCEKLVNQPNIQKLIHSTDRSFDLIIYEPFGSQCIYGLLHKFKSPSIQFLPNTITPMLDDSMGNPSTSSYIPDALMEEDTMTSIMKKHFPDPSLPSITELETNASFLFLHSHPILNYPKPLTPNTIEVGGLHIKAAGNLPQMWSISSLLILLLMGATAESARILFLFAFPAKSHVGAFTPYIEELTKRGHEVTVVSAFPRKQPLANYTEIIVPDTLHAKEKGFNVFEMGDTYFLPMIFFFFLMGSESCERLLQDPNMQKLIHSKEMKFDLVIYEPFFTECTYGLIHKFNAPSIQILPNTLMPLMGNPVGNPNTASYITDIMMEQEMQGFTGRLMNSFRLGTVYLFRKFVVVPKMDALIKKYYPDPTIPSVEDIESKVAFLFLHSHPILHLPKPLTPNTIELAGLHITDKTKKLPQDLQKFFDEAPDGVIYFSLGSNIRSVDMPEKMRNAILNTFANLKQKVLWKWEDDTLPGQPPNVKLSKWVPQHDVLAHPNLKLFITHGGLMSLQESIYFGVPLIAIPVFADQRLNTLRAQKAGYAISLHLNNITEETLNWAIQEMLTEPSYRENVKEASRIFRDQPQKPIERAIFWTEYAIRHKGAPHLRSTALKLNLFEYYLVDVIIFFLVSVLVFITISLMCMRKIFTCMCSKSKTSNVSSSKKKK
ncbi:UDP-glucuronosyltransferase 1-1 [Gryllus bimaculatus]|nr:UDP-glucuronosyltransferase 1-1 [Gryllus bimaculatus]